MSKTQNKSVPSGDRIQKWQPKDMYQRSKTKEKNEKKSKNTLYLVTYIKDKHNIPKKPNKTKQKQNTQIITKREESVQKDKSRLSNY